MFRKLREKLSGGVRGKIREKLKRGLTKTRSRLREGLARIRITGRKIDEDILAEIEEVLVTADLGVELATEICDALRTKARGRTIESTDDLLTLVRDEIVAHLPPHSPEPDVPPPRVTLIIGVNGSGKTTTTGKLAARWSREGRSVTVAAADTFRAAAVEQLVVWAERAGAQVVRSSPGADPAAVAFDAASSAAAREAERLLVDTAGRLHNKKPLMDELAKIARAVGKKIEGAPHETYLVLDGTTGRNAVLQAREFSRVVKIDGLILTKLDGTARGGVAVAIGRELGIPVRYVGVGESVDDLIDFDATEFVEGLLAPETSEVDGDAEDEVE
jgi:fused signal recognition particle receptor